MAAIEYGSDYWCVILSDKRNGAASETIHLHADGMKIDAGTLVFTSAGRRPAGTEPSAKHKGKDQKGGKGENGEGIVYFALAPGAWKIAYSANLKDGSPVSVEHWDAEQPGETVPPNSRAARI